jgi:phospholipid-binding lipoprotein MlaA
LITGDRYLFIRDAFNQRREFLIKDGVVEDAFLDDDFAE